MPTTVVPYSTVPASRLSAGMTDVAATQGIAVSQGPDGWHVSDAAAFQSFAASYSGSASQLSWTRSKRQAELDALFDANFDLAKFIRGGTATTITAANVGTFLATITNNYRSLRAQITAAATMTALNAINVNTGWPSNP